jgi:peptidoglycan-associated lipoprotein
VTRSITTTATVVALVLAVGLAAGCARRTRTATAPEAMPAASPAAASQPAPAPAVAAAPTPAVTSSPRLAPGGGAAAATPAAPAATPAPVAAAPAATPPPVAAAPADRRSRLETIYFAFDRAEIQDQFRPILTASADWLKRNPNARVQIEGHCDERGSVQYNLALGERRAESAKRYLESLGVEGSRLSTISYGEERPAVAGDNEEAHSRNRRAEFVVTAQ